MLRFLTFDQHRYTMQLFLEHGSEELRRAVQVVGYREAEASLGRRDLTGDVIVLCDLERMTADQLDELAALGDRCLRLGARRVLNDARRVLRRYELGRRLHEDGLHRFRPWRWTEVAESGAADRVRYPVFLRDEHEHDGARSPLLHSPTELAAWMEEHGQGTDAISSIDGRRRDWLVVEFEDTRRSGESLFHKAGAFFLDGAVAPRHLFYSPRWMVKGGGTPEPWMVRREQEYLEHNWGRRQVAEVCALAGIDYGRIDFAFTGVEGPGDEITGPIVTFEINTNPTVLDAGDLADVQRQAVTRRFLETFTEALLALAA
ncbi:MAG: hypothetical protein SX243_23595 [Acidobacteriota bacterium]|nr:hypothetical protein [Acidobacteriota bacterium]